jgi:SAM-dependent methyltransferase
VSVDVVDLEAFYAGPLGTHARRVVLDAVGAAWGLSPPRSLLGLGFTTPFLDLAAVQASCRRLAFMPARQGAIARAGPVALVDPGILPLPDDAVDRVLAIHLLENVPEAGDVLGEIWRVLDPTGRLLLIVPNRRGLWARLDTTPFGHGQPYSRSQQRRRLRDSGFEAESWREVLFVPPLRSRLVQSGAPAWEAVGTRLRLPGAGLHVVDARKVTHRPVPVRGRIRQSRRMPVLVPVPATAPAAHPASGIEHSPTRL